MSEEENIRKEVQLTVGKGGGRGVVDGVELGIVPDGNVTVYADEGVEVKPAMDSAASESGLSLYEANFAVTAVGCQASTKGSVYLQSSGNAQLEIGMVADDGTIYAGISPTTQQRMYVAPVDAPSLMRTFNQAVEYAETLQMSGKNDFRLPDMAELKVIINNSDKGALKGTFNLANPYSDFYWSSTPSGAYLVSSDYTRQYRDDAENRFALVASSVRCIR